MIWLKPNKEHAIEIANSIAKEFENKFPNAIEGLFNIL